MHNRVQQTQLIMLQHRICFNRQSAGKTFRTKNGSVRLSSAEMVLCAHHHRRRRHRRYRRCRRS